MTDLVTFGETMLRLSPPDDVPVEAATSFDVYVAGAESNVAVAAQRLGVDAVWLSKVPDSPPGRRVTGALRRHGVEPAVVRTDEGRQGTYYLETGEQPRGATAVYDRELTPIRTATAAELPTGHIEAADAFHTTGITPALSETVAETTADLLELAQAAGTTTVFDLNYRSKLWSPADSRARIRDLLDAVDVFVVAARDAETVLERPGPAESVARDLADEYGFETTIVTRGDEGAVAVHAGEVLEQPVFEAGDPHPVGTGDAFVGGFLAERLRNGSVSRALEYGAATAALKRTIPGDMAVVTPDAVERVIDDDARDIAR